MDVPADAPQDVHEANAVGSWKMVPQEPSPGPSYLTDLLNAIQSQSVSGNPALQSLA